MGSSGINAELVKIMGYLAACLVFYGLCISLSSAACGDECRAKGGRCLWKNPGDGSEFLGSYCREGKWGEGEYCYCGTCYGRTCEQTPTCNGKCQKASPGYGYTSSSYCNEGLGCKCWEKKT
eukprot:TRINITY_DN11571_c0_g1_i1.p1 TRINITY_DN11571_c0_g1~~TRINITY_DN11571_c0_g1_i1.p1  ORF type:complete len:122 (-),score=23.88 TRINITY_DN11571_c0_g1_i1:172-537(-)